MPSAKRSRSVVAPVWSVSVVAAFITLVLTGACGARVVVDGEASGAGGSLNEGVGGAGVGDVGDVGVTSSTGSTGSTGAGGGTTGVIQVPNGTPSDCSGVVYTLVMSLEDLIGCTPFAPSSSGPQCSGKFVLHDPCGCPHIINESTEDGHATNEDDAYDACVAMGCCGPTLQGCSTCEPLPAVGHCDSFTSQCVPGP